MHAPRRKCNDERTASQIPSDFTTNHSILLSLFVLAFRADHIAIAAEELIPADSSSRALEIGLASGIRFLRSKDLEDKTPRPRSMN